MLIDLCADDPEYVSVEDQLQSSIREHKDNCGGVFVRYNIIKVCSSHSDFWHFVFFYTTDILDFTKLILQHFCCSRPISKFICI